MKILVACLEDKAFEYQGEVGMLNYSQTWPHFWMPCVMGDDWLQRTNCPIQAAPVDFRRLDSCAFALYASKEEAVRFVSWLAEAAEAVSAGYRTMRG